MPETARPSNLLEALTELRLAVARAQGSVDCALVTARMTSVTLGLATDTTRRLNAQLKECKGLFPARDISCAAA